MKKKDLLDNYSISDATLRNWKKLGYITNIDDIDINEIKTVIRNKKNVRRNKKNNTEHVIPISYIKDKNIPIIISQILDLQKKYNILCNEILIEAIKKILFPETIPNEVYKVLGEESTNKDFIDDFNDLVIIYNKNDDFLGCLYMSLLSKGKKDVKGIFYTPFSVVKKIVDSIDVYENIKILDPGCGSGNFLIQMYNKMKGDGFTTKQIIDSLHGFDIDEIAVLIAKINMYIIDKNIKYNELKIKKSNFLIDTIKEKFDVIVGNPPWGKKYKKQEKEELKSKYGIIFAKQDSFSQFIIKSFEILKDDGVLGFVLPSSILNIAVHSHIREFLLNYKIDYIINIGREFNEIVTDVIIIKVTKKKNENNKCFVNKSKILQSQFLKNPYYNFLIPSKIPKNIIKKIKKLKSFHLNDKNSKFSLGIVTGNNKKYLFDSQIPNSEPIISGKELTKYNFNYELINKYIIFEKNKFQQVASEMNFREEKIIYKFIGSKLCFTVENKGLLTLNSANIINIKNCNIYYISAILNSRITQLFFTETYKTHKVLKSHIQSFYIFDFDQNIKNKIISLSKTSFNIKYNEEIESIIYEQLRLTQEEIKYLKNNC